MDRDELIHIYFKLRLYYKDIMFCLAHRDNAVVSLRHLKITSHRNINGCVFTEVELGHTGQLQWMHQTCIEEGIAVGQETASR